MLSGKAFYSSIFKCFGLCTLFLCHTGHCKYFTLRIIRQFIRTGVVARRDYQCSVSERVSNDYHVTCLSGIADHTRSPLGRKLLRSATMCCTM